MAKKWKAGGIPYFVNEQGTLRVLLVTSTDPTFGGPDPAIAKGYPEKGENSARTAIREMSEETGVKVKDVVDTQFLGVVESKHYSLYTYAFKLAREVPPITDWEAVGRWYNAYDALELIYANHKPMLLALIEAVE